MPKRCIAGCVTAAGPALRGCPAGALDPLCRCRRLTSALLAARESTSFAEAALGEGVRLDLLRHPAPSSGEAGYALRATLPDADLSGSLGHRLASRRHKHGVSARPLLTARHAEAFKTK